MAHGNTQVARRMYLALYPQQKVPHIQTFVSIHARLRETRTSKKTTDILAVLNRIEEV